MSQSISASALVIPLPTATAAPVQNSPRRGRYPRNVMTLGRVRQLNFCAQVKKQQQIEHAEKIASQTRAIAILQRSVEAGLYEVALMRQQGAQS